MQLFLNEKWQMLCLVILARLYIVNIYSLHYVPES